MSAAAFVAAIQAAPDDPTPKLVYADWLDEHGESERAEILRVQCKLLECQSCDRTGRNAVSPCACSLLRSRARALLDGRPVLHAQTLQDQGQTLADVLLEFAGTAAGFTDGLPQAVLVEWCKATEPDRRVWNIQRTMPLIAMLQNVEAASTRPRWEAVTDCKLNLQLFVDTIYRDPGMLAYQQEVIGPIIQSMVLDGFAETTRSKLNDPRVETARMQGKAIVLRDLKRRVLALFPEVKIVRTANVVARQIAVVPGPLNAKRRLSYEFMSADVEKSGLLLDDSGRIRQPYDVSTRIPLDHDAAKSMAAIAYARECLITQMIPAPDLIPPESRYGPSPLRGAYRRWTEREAMRAADASRYSLDDMDVERLNSERLPGLHPPGRVGIDRDGKIVDLDEPHDPAAVPLDEPAPHNPGIDPVL